MSDLVTLLKVFDVDFATDDDCEIIGKLNPNHLQDVAKAVRLLLLPTFLSYQDTAQARLLSSLRSTVADPKEEFELLFNRIELAFGEPLADRLGFMREVLNVLESVDKERGA